MNELTNVTTGEVRLSYVHLFKPYAAMQGQEEKYSCTILVPKTDTDTMARINAAIEAAKQRGTSDKWNGVAFGPECKGHWVFTASAKVDYPPEIVDRMGNPIINQSEVYSGMYGRVNVTFSHMRSEERRGSAAAWDRSRSCVTVRPWVGVHRQQHRPSEPRSLKQQLHSMGHKHRLLQEQQDRHRGGSRQAGSTPLQEYRIKQETYRASGPVLTGG